MLRIFVLFILNAAVQAQTEGSIRLVGGATPLEGRVELFFGGEWGTMCDDGAGTEEAIVACRQLGYSGGTSLGNTVIDGDGKIWLDDVVCIGNESSLFDCNHPAVGTQNCVHSEDWGVQCSNISSTIPVPTTTTASIPEQTTVAGPNNRTAIAFSAARKTSQVVTNNKQVFYTTELVNEGGAFDLNSSVFTPPYAGYYWFHYSVGVESYGQADAYLTGSQRISNAMRSDSTYSGADIISRDEIFNLGTVCSQVKVWSDYNLYSDTYLQTSVSGFSITSLSEEYPVVFSLALTKSLSCPVATKVPYNRVLIDTHGIWSSSQREFIAPVSGTYVISLIAGTDKTRTLGIGLYSYGAVMTSIQIGSTDHQYESLGKTIITELNEGDHLYAACYYYQTSYLYSELRAQTLLTGFLYKPRSFVGYSWSVATVEAVTGPQNPVRFEVELVDRGNGWNKNTNTYTVLETGNYYISLTAGVNSAQRTNMQLQVNNSTIAAVYMYSTDHNGIKTRSRSIVVRLYEGDTVRVYLPSGYYLYSNDNRITSFTGFRVSA